MKTIFFLFLIFFVTNLYAEEDATIINREYKSFLKQIKEGKVDEVIPQMILTEKEIDEIFNETAPKVKILELMIKMKEYQIKIKDKITKEITDKLEGTDDLVIKLTKIEDKEINKWLKEGISIYRAHIKYSNGNSSGTSTFLVINGKFKFIRGLDSLPDGLKNMEKEAEKSK